MLRRGASLLLAVLLAACSTPKPAVPPSAPSAPAAPVAAVRLARVAFSDLPDWNAARFDAALASFRRGCALLAKKEKGKEGSAHVLIFHFLEARRLRGSKARGLTTD